MKQTSASLVLAGVGGFVAGMVVHAVLSNLGVPHGKFFEVTLKDFLGPGVAVLVALLINSHVNRRLRNEQLIHGITGDVFKAAEDALRAAFTAWEQYIATEDRPTDLEHQVSRSLDRLSVSLNDLRELEALQVVRRNAIPHSDLRKQYLKLKRLMTNHPFGSRLQALKFSDETVADARVAHQQIKRKLFALRIDLLR